MNEVEPTLFPDLDLTVTHLTLTGPSAGLPFCGCNREKCKNMGHRFCHVPYSGIDKFLSRPEICPECKRAWYEDG